MKNIKIFLFLISLFLGAFSLSAHIQMGSLFNDHMVLQQDTLAHIWGWTDQPGATVTLKVSWAKGKVKAKSDSKGRFDLRIQTPKGSFTPQTVEVSDGEKLTIQDVLIGEVWLAGGQSNMEMPLHGFASCPVENSAQYIAESGKYKGKLHICTVTWATNAEPVDTVSAPWTDCTPLTARDFCAVAYFFGIQLTEALNVPVGMINSSLGATRVEGWLPREVMEKYGTEDLNTDEIKNCSKVVPQYDVNRGLPMIFYNGMIHPLVGYSLKGFLFYQGEANVGNYAPTYRDRFVDMVREWRDRWQAGDLPFYYVEICPFCWSWTKDPSAVPMLREAQYQAQDKLPNMGMVCTNDLVKDYDCYCIHPCMKKEVGDRLCYWALGQAYGIPGIDYRYPEYERMEVKDDVVTLYFKNAESGFNRRIGIEGFEVCGADSVWHKTGNVGISDRDKLTVRCSEVKNPVAVRYCFKNWSPGTLKGNNGLPIIPFRTDNFAH